jgi:hypothetical protein
VTRTAVVIATAVLLIGLAGATRESFINPSPLSRQHSGPEFARLAEAHGGGQGCVLCHDEAQEDVGTLLRSAKHAAETSLPFAKFNTTELRDFSRVDRACVACHRAQSFHQANVGVETSCSLCHREHQGTNSLTPVAARHCTKCHADQPEMRTAALKSRLMPAALFARKTVPGLVVHPVTRPTDGYTRVIHGFDLDHPEFQALRPPATDSNPLKFNHRIHLTGDIPPLNGRPLDCASCHQPDASGAFMQRISFEQNCRACHALSFDDNPGMALPHGDATVTRAFLRSLPTHYADYATRQLGITRQDDVRSFVEKQMRSLRERTASGENLERSVFFADGITGEATIIAGVKGRARAKFAGCAYCHEVTPRGEATPLVAAPRTPDRWMLHSRFDHRRHATVACTQCHAAEQSTSASDILIPRQKSCVQCHGPKGGVSYDCSTCHSFHNDRPASLPATLTNLAP